jgi:hypothetical protein
MTPDRQGTEPAEERNACKHTPSKSLALGLHTPAKREQSTRQERTEAPASGGKRLRNAVESAQYFVRRCRIVYLRDKISISSPTNFATIML